jgi:hypothetical protein
MFLHVVKVAYVVWSEPDIRSCFGGKVSSFFWLNSGTVIIDKTVLFVAHKYGFLYTSEHWEQNPPL